MDGEASPSLRVEQPFRVEYAKSNRAACKGCGRNITKDELRLAKMVKNFKFDGMSPHWFHFDCFFMKNRPKSTGDIGHFTSIRYEDQKKIESKIGKPSDKAFCASDFTVEYSKSGRSTCILCELKIPKDEIRIGKFDEESDIAHQLGKPVPRWFHADCFASSRLENGFTEAADKLPGFEGLEPEDKAMLKKQITKVAEKRKAGEKNDASEPNKKKSKQEKEYEKKLKEQSDLLFSYIEKIQKLKPKEIDQLLEYNGYDHTKDKSKKIERLADAMAFGALKKCPECVNGQLYFRMAGYICSGMKENTLRCIYETRKPERKPFLIPEELKEKHTFLADYKYKPGERIIPKVQGPVDAIDPLKEALKEAAETSTSNGGDGSNDVTIDPSKPLKGHKIVIVGKLNMPAKECKKVLTDLGAKPVTEFDRTVLFGISTEKEVSKDGRKVDEARQYNILLVNEKVLDDIKSAGVEDIPSVITKHSLSDWGTDDVQKRFINLVNKDKVKSFKSGKSGSGNKSGKSQAFPERQKLLLKGGLAVDPQSGLEDIAIVYKKGKDVYSTVLNKVDLHQNKNSYYKIQLLKDERSNNHYWVFTAWGRVGTDIGDTKLEEFRSLESAIARFEEIFKEKTANEWSKRENFVRKATLYFPLDIDYGASDDNPKMELGKSDLPMALQKLILMIFDIDLMQREMKEFELDMTKMPLGKLSKKQIMSAYNVLKDLSQILESESKDSKAMLISQTEKFYTLIPHNMGSDKLPIITTKKEIEEKSQMLDALLEMEVALGMMSDVKKEENSVDLIKQHYMKLNADLSVIQPSDPDYGLVQEYVTNTHAPTHKQYKLKIMDVFKVARHGEEERYKKYINLHNKMLLWHGSRVTNFASILSQGLKIAPPEAPVTGYMFGKGIYFSDMVSKSANYCCAHLNKNVGLLLLSEVALGDMWELKDANFVTQLPKGKHSVKGLGKTAPDASKHKTFENNITVPCGPPKPTKVKDSSLLYNEYIVYDVAQLKIRYLVMVEFQNLY